MFGVSKALLLATGCLAAGLAWPAPAQAQQAVSVTGCLSKGTGKDAFSLQGTDGKTYTLTSSSVDLSEHVGHKVTVTGTPAVMETGALKDTSMMKEAAPEKETGAAAGGTLDVTKLKHLSTQCK